MPLNGGETSEPSSRKEGKVFQGKQAEPVCVGLDLRRGEGELHHDRCQKPTLNKTQEVARGAEEKKGTQPRFICLDWKTRKRFRDYVLTRWGSKAPLDQ